MKSLHLFHFTPSLMSSETLEDLFVQREPLAQRLTDLVRESALTQNKHHTLLVGPRGIGKTHLVALVYYRVKAMTDLTDKTYIAWLREEEWGVESFLDLLLRLCRALQEEYSDTFPAERVESLFQQEPAAAQRLAERLLQEFIGPRTLLLLVENLDDMFKGMGDKGQRQLRAFFQENSFSTILATSQSLFNGVSRQTAPFYGFFRVQHLQDFTVEDATLLLKNIANLKGDSSLAAFIETPTGRARVRTVNHLAGGNPRVYVIFSEFLTRESLDELVSPFMSMLDELTPYYQARMSYLSVQQRKIIEFLCDRSAPATVKEIAKRCFITSQTASSQLRELKEKGYVHADPLGPTGRDTYYELHEPLMRMSVEVKKSRSGPIHLLIDFLRLWYPIKELRHQLERCKPEAKMEREYLTLALKAAEENSDPRIQECSGAFNSYFSQKSYVKSLEVADELVALEPCGWTYGRRGLSLLALNRFDEAFQDLDRSISLDSSLAVEWGNRGTTLHLLGRNEEAIDSIQNGIKIDPKDANLWASLAHVYDVMGKTTEALSAWKKSVKLDPKDAHLWLKKGESLLQSKRHEEAKKSFLKAVDIDPTMAQAWRNLADLAMIAEAERMEEALQYNNEAMKYSPTSRLTWWQRADILRELKHYQEATEFYDKVIEQQKPNVMCIYFYRAEVLFALNNFSEGILSLKNALQQFTDQDLTGHVASHSIPIVQHVLTNSTDTKLWTSQISTIVQTYLEHNLAEALELALVNSIYTITMNRHSSIPAIEWYEAWKEATKNLPTFELPLRLLNTAIRYNDIQDKRIMLELPLEERKILEGLLTPKEADAGSSNKQDVEFL